MKATQAPPYADWRAWCLSEPAPAEEVEYFKGVPWANKLIEHSNFQPVPTPSRLPEAGTSNNAFFWKTLAPSASIPSPIVNWLLLMKKGLKIPPEAPKGTIGRNAGSGDSLPTRPVAEADCVLLLNLGADLDGFGGVAHGGSLCAILDEFISLVVELHRQSVTDDRGSLFTVRLSTVFRGPCPTPGNVLVKGWLEAWEGRKWLLKAQICDEKENVLTEGEGIWVSAKSEKM